MTDHAEWVLLASCATGLEADQFRLELEAAGIPALVRGAQPGIFGAGFQGPSMGGLDVYVPSPELERARALLDEGAP